MIPSGFKQLNNQDGSILVTVLTVLSILLTIFIFALTYTLSRYSIHTMNRNILVATHLSEAGVRNAVNKFNNNSFDADYEYNSPNGGKIKVSYDYWGGYYLVRSTGQFANQKVLTTSIIGTDAKSYFSDAITVCDERYPFVVAGNTRILGDVNTGPLGIETGQIRGEAITSAQYHQGEINLSKNLTVPQINKKALDGYFSSMHLREANCQNYKSASLLLNNSTNSIFDNSFSVIVENNLELNNYLLNENNEIRSFFVNGFVEIRRNSKISSLLEIVAEGSIYVQDSTILDNMILYSQDSIIIEDNASFSGTLIAHSKIIVKDNARLRYPTLLILIPTESSDDKQNGIFLSSKEQLESVCYLSKNNNDSSYMKDVIYLDTVTNLTGAIVSNQIVDLRGQVFGSIVTESFNYNLPPTTYINWAMNLYVNRFALDYTPELPLLSDTTHFQRHNIIREDREVL